MKEYNLRVTDFASTLPCVDSCMGSLKSLKRLIQYLATVSLDVNM